MKDLTFEQLPNQVAKLSSEINELKILITQKNQTQQNFEEILDAKACAKLIGVEIPTLYGYTQRREIPFNKKGKKLIFLRSEILNWIKSGKRKSLVEIADESSSYLKIKRGKNE